MKTKLSGAVSILVVVALLAGWAWHRRPRALSEHEFDARVMARVGGGAEQRLSRDAYLRMGGPRRAFERYDANGDGSLDATEFARALAEEDPNAGQVRDVPRK